MEGKEENDLRLAALCKSLGDLWSEDDIVEVSTDIPHKRGQNAIVLYLGNYFLN